MSLLLKIELTILIILITNGATGIGCLITVKNYVHPFHFVRAWYGVISAILLVLAIVFVPMIFIWHLY